MSTVKCTLCDRNAVYVRSVNGRPFGLCPHHVEETSKAIAAVLDHHQRRAAAIALVDQPQQHGGR